MSSNMNESAREGKPTCLIVNPARRFGGKPDRLFSDLTARTFWRAGWNIVWMVDYDDTLADRPDARIRRSLPATPAVDARLASALGIALTAGAGSCRYHTAMVVNR